MKPLVLADEALAEMRDAADWYEEQRRGLGDRFLDEADCVLATVARRPKSFRRLATSAADLEIRRAFLDRFPFAVVFLEMAHEIRVVAIAHVRREPEYWLYRLAD
jgi:plasmid stabilization system protein ParE